MAPEPIPTTFTLDEVLALVGALDDSSGFDTPRERFRRFLGDRVKDIRAARALIEQCQRTPADQHRRALQDLTVLLGRFLGFEPTFGTYERTIRGVRADGQWSSRRRLHVVLGILNDEVARGDLDSLTRALQGGAASHRDSDTPHIGLAVITPLHAGGRTDRIVSGEAGDQDLRVASLRSIVWLAEMVTSGAIAHDEVVKLLTAALSVDVVIDLLQRLGGGATAARLGRAAATTPRPLSLAAPPPTEPSFWLATIVPDGMTTAEQFIHAVVVKRHIIGVMGANGQAEAPRPGDSICLFVRDKGAVGRAQVVSVFQGGAELIRGSDRFDRMIRLKEIEVFERPIQPMTAIDLGDIAEEERLGPVLMSLTREQFTELTTPPGQRAQSDPRAGMPSVSSRRPARAEPA